MAEGKDGGDALSSSFKYPEFFHFPPFFTLQPSPDTQKTQLKIWVDLVVSFCKHHGLTRINVHEHNPLQHQSPLFANPQISRALSADAIVTVLDSVVAAGYGRWVESVGASAGSSSSSASSSSNSVAAGAGVQQQKNVCAITWRSFADLSVLIYKWAQDVNLIGTVGTLEDIYAGDDATGQEFFGLAPELVLAAVEELVAAKKAILVPGKTLADLGIKYLSC